MNGPSAAPAGAGAGSERLARLEGIGLHYGKVAALTAITLDLPAGCMVGLIGPDGVGKSSLLALVAGARALQAGRLEVLGVDMRDAGRRRAIIPRIAYMPQGLGKNLYPTLSVFENIDFFGRLFGQGRAERARRIEELTTRTGLRPFLDRPAGKLSGGMKQKLGLCCALIHDPDLLILDEPTTGVDPLSRRQFWELIAHIRAERAGMSVLVATAYMEEAARFDSLVAMDAGRVLASGAPGELLAQTGTATLEEAFVALLPEEKRRGHQAVAIPPLGPDGDGEAAIEARDLTMRFGDFTAVDRVSFRIRARRDLRFPGFQRLRQDHHHEDADRSAATERGRGLAVRPGGGPARSGHPAPGGLHVAVVFALHRADGAAEPRPACAAVRGAGGGDCGAGRGDGDALRPVRGTWTRCRTRCRWGCASACRSPWR